MNNKKITKPKNIINNMSNDKNKEINENKI